ncbi:MAG: hypothetical protein HZC19_01110 [Candidatus Omnitrophica bacterium]|nr:hypothetical protein [Candidatus Omnitrophota bacterium]
MGKYLSVIIGAVVSLLGLWGLIIWWGDFLLVLRGSIPAMLIFGGAIAVIAGLSEIKDELASKKEEKPRQT